MKRIIGIKVGPNPSKEATNPREDVRPKKTKRDITPSSLVPEQKEPKRAPWRGTSSTVSQPVGRLDLRDASNKAKLRENPSAFKATATQGRERADRTKKHLSSQFPIGGGRPLWGFKGDDQQAHSRSQSRSQLPRLGSNRSNFKPSQNQSFELSRRPASGLQFEKPAFAGKEETRHHEKKVGVMDVEKSNKEPSKDDLQNQPLQSKQTADLTRNGSLTNLKSAMKKFPKIKGITSIGDGHEESRNQSKFFVESDRGDLSKQPETSRKTPEKPSSHLDYQTEIRNQEGVLDEEGQSGLLGEAFDSNPAIVTDPEDVEAIRRITHYNRDHPNSNFFIEFNQQEVKGRTSEKFGGVKRIMTPQLRSKRLSKRKDSEGGEVDEHQQANRERRNRSSSGCEVHRREKLHGLPAERCRRVGDY
jgi:hypothetical protein